MQSCRSKGLEMVQFGPSDYSMRLGLTGQLFPSAQWAMVSDRVIDPWPARTNDANYASIMDGNALSA